ncbi:TonB family protein [Betaproteobacteria bacterium LSUCC0117]|jgi:periplasmic protein TonB|nr:TonB family protein [Betaproteobacteria bacterium LSUCC0117]MDP4862510.1 TonB family protein [Burkholderiaceae bacterium]
MPTPSDPDAGIDAALSFGATSSNALDQRLEPRRLGVWLGFAFVLHVAGFAAFVVWQPTWFERQTAAPSAPDAPVDVTWLGEARAPEAAPSVPGPAPAPAPARPSPPSPPPPETGKPLPAEPAIARAPKPSSTRARANEPTPVPEAVAVAPTLMTSPPSTPGTSATLATPAPSATQEPLSPLAARAEPVDAPAATGSASPSPSSPAASKPVAREAEAPVSVVRVEPSLIASSQQPPVYPRASRRAGEAGTVVLRINIAASGAVTATAVAVSSGFERLDAAAQKAVQQWRFTPGTVDGVPTAMPLQVPIRFELQ